MLMSITNYIEKQVLRVLRWKVEEQVKMPLIFTWKMACFSYYCQEW